MRTSGRVGEGLAALCLLLSISAPAEADWSSINPAPNVTGYGGGCSRMQFFDDLHGYVAGTSEPIAGTGFIPALIKTADGAQTWTGGRVNELGGSLTGRYVEMHFVDANNGYMAWDGGGTKIVVTTNAGGNWTTTNVAAGTPKYVWALSATTAIAAGNSGAGTTTPVQIWRTTTSGAQWNIVHTDAAGFPGPILFFDANTGITNRDLLVLRTVNGGATWAPIAISNVPQITGHQYARVSATEAFVMGTNSNQLSVLYKTVDAGATWTLVGTTIGCTALSIAFVDATHGVAGCSSLANMTRNRYTADGGITWVDESYPSDYAFLGATGGNGVGCVAFPSTGVAYGQPYGATTGEKRLMKRTPGSNPTVDGAPDAGVGDDAAVGGDAGAGGDAGTNPSSGDSSGCRAARGGDAPWLLALLVTCGFVRRRRRRHFFGGANDAA